MVECGTCQPATQIAFVDQGNVVAVAEYNQLTLWDVRQKAACIKRLKVR